MTRLRAVSLLASVPSRPSGSSSPSPTSFTPTSLLARAWCRLPVRRGTSFSTSSSAARPPSITRPAHLGAPSAACAPLRQPAQWPSFAPRRSAALSCRWASSTTNDRPKTAIFFPGQGVQKVGMLTPWLEAFPRTAREIVQEIDHFMGYKLSDVIQEGPGKRLTATANAQPAIMATSILILRILEREFGFRVAERIDVTLGHSLGEFAALVAGGYLEFADSLYLVRKRAEAMARATQQAQEEHGGEYGMVAVVTEPEYMESLLGAIYKFLGYRPLGEQLADDVLRSSKPDDGGEFFREPDQGHPTAISCTYPPPPPPPPPHLPPSQQVLIANINSKNQIVLSGDIERIKSLMSKVRLFLGHDARAVRLNSDSPFHSPIMRPAVAEMRQLLKGHSCVEGREAEDIVTFPGSLPCISNVTARPFRSRAELKELLARQCEETVRWWDSIRYLDQEEKVRRWVGIGPGKVGRNLVGKEVGMRGKDLVKGGGVWAITDPSEIEEVLRGLEETESFVEDESVDEE